MVILYCATCGVAFNVKPSEANTRKYCSRTCTYTSPEWLDKCKREHTQESKTKISLGNKGKRLGQKASLEVRQKMSDARTKEKNSFWGKQHTDETKKILSEQRRGVPLSDERKGSNHHWWKGGISSPNNLIRQSAEYKEWRRQVFERDNYTCQLCGASGVYLNADHIKPFATHEHLRFELGNGRTLCVSCHRATPTFGVGTRHQKINSIEDAVDEED